LLSENDIELALRRLERSRYPERDRVILLLITDAALRPRQIANLRWGMVVDPQGRIRDSLHLRELDSRGAGLAPLSRRLKAAVQCYRRTATPQSEDFLLSTERAERMSAGTVSMWYQRRLKDLEEQRGGTKTLKKATEGAMDPRDEPESHTTGGKMDKEGEGEGFAAATDGAQGKRRSPADRDTVRACVSSAIATAARSNRKLALVSVDLDDFSRVNTVFGDAFGDEVLAEAAGRLAGDFGGDERVLRLHADKFVALLPGLAAREDASATVRRAWTAFHEAINCRGQSIRLTASLGVSVFPDDGRDAETLLRHADAALHAAKTEGRDRFVFFSGMLARTFSEELDLEARMRDALEHDAFVLYYQPTVDAYTRRIVGAEALIRWRLPGGGLIPPNKFIPTAEKCGFISTLGRWVLETTTRQIRAWQAEGRTLVPISVNVCASQLRDPNFAPLVKWVLEKNEVDPRLLSIELTESIFLDHADYVLESMQKLAGLGIHFSIDDFGTGYSSLRYLRQLPIHQLKIDQYFVRDIDDDRDAAAMVRAIVAMTQSMGMIATAEGVETEEQLTVLRAYQCPQAQGYLFQRPMAGEALAEALAAQEAQIAQLFARPPSERETKDQWRTVGGQVI